MRKVCVKKYSYKIAGVGAELTLFRSPQTDKSFTCCKNIFGDRETEKLLRQKQESLLHARTPVRKWKNNCPKHKKANQKKQMVRVKTSTSFFLRGCTTKKWGFHNFLYPFSVLMNGLPQKFVVKPKKRLSNFQILFQFIRCS